MQHYKITIRDTLQRWKHESNFILSREQCISVIYMDGNTVTLSQLQHAATSNIS